MEGTASHGCLDLVEGYAGDADTDGVFIAGIEHVHEVGRGTDRYKGGGLSKSALMGIDRVHAAIDDGLLDIPFRVVSFETVFFDNMGNAVPVASNGAQFSERQRETFRRLSRNRRFYIRGVKAVGPDGITRTLSYPMEVIVK